MRMVEGIYGQKTGLWAWVLFLASLSGCVPAFSPIVLGTVEKHLTYEVVIENPQAYTGSVVLWGGVIQTVIIGPEGAQLVVAQTPVDSRGYPEAGVTAGDFIAHTTLKLDLKIFQRDMKVTVVGEIDGVSEGEQGSMEYSRPLVRVIEIRAWTGRLWGIFPLNKGWEVDETGPSPLRLQSESGILGIPP